MRLTFRQGIARYQTDIYGTSTFLQKSSQGDAIDLIVSPDPTIVVFAHKGATYVIEESKTVNRAWGPFTGQGTKYLYWDINLLDASLTRGYTAFPQIVSGTAPSEPAEDQHWFDTTNHQMKVWNGRKWLDKLRVFAGTFSSQAIVVPSPLGSQVGETGSFDGGNIVLDSYGKPLRQSDGSFVTSTTELAMAGASANKLKLESEVIIGMASENIPKFSFVQIDKAKSFKLARSSDWRSRIHGLVTEDLYMSEVGNIETNGLVRNEQWNWPDGAVGRPVFCGQTGEVTIEAPQAGALQIAGYVFDKDAIYIDIKQATILTNITVEDRDQPVGPAGRPPTPLFTTNPATGNAPLTVSFKSTSVDGPTVWEWDFTNDGVVDATTENATYTYMIPGTYDVKLYVRNQYGENTLVKTGAVVVSSADAQVGTQTNLSIQLNAPLQVNKGDDVTVNVVVINSGYLPATRVARTVVIDDVGGQPVVVKTKPAGSVVAHDAGKTILTMPNVAYFASGQNVSASFTVTAPHRNGVITIRGGVVSPEADSTMADNTSTLTVRIK